MRKKHILIWFLFGLGTQLQLVASLSIAELFVFLAAPILVFKEWPYMRRNGIAAFFWISMALVLGCVVACWANHTPPGSVLRGMAVCCLMPCTIVVGHWLLRSDMNGFKWMFVGGAISGVLSTFILQKSVEVSMLAGGMEGQAAAADIMNGATYWIHRLGAFVSLPSKGWYLKCPIAYSVLAPLFMAGFALMTSISGRASSARAIAAAALVAIGGRSQRTLQTHVCNHFGRLVLIGVIIAFSIKQCYQTAASNGWLGEASRVKYEAQTKGDKGIMALLLGGRMESFCGLLACVDKPIVGFGPWAEDVNGYRAEFLRRYGSDEDYRHLLEAEAYARTYGLRLQSLIPCHSVITELWLWYGIFGLLFCGYMIFVVIRYLKQDCWFVPQWFFWLGASIPGLFWDLAFNPFSDRIGIPMMVVACLLVRAARMGVCPLPMEMITEIRERNLAGGK